ncbi:unnamed protein product [Adineta steineri]|uniref:F-box domain-containing protein n=2 Tax=Adineta steineri TaxID=433720 RepID=A0A818RT36_9BILA|nr:unnamed protein product [Adineta steineri]CAF1219694.1 unnamed protein product [Adineta steineri]CAF3662610.1 unnamed protein product [Adineta steineri]CAF3749014.1 unnamed protein product [Adineta steineri]
MFDSYVGLNDLPDEILIIIFQKLNNTELLYSLQGVNKRLNKIIHDPIFTTRLAFVKWLSHNFIDLFSCDIIRDKFCSEILPAIHQNIKWLDLASPSMKHVLHTVEYPNLVTLALYNINEESAQSLFTDKTLSSGIFKNQITTLFLAIDADDDDYNAMLSSVNNIYNCILTVFHCLITLILFESSYINCVRLNLDCPPISFRSSILRKLNIKVQSFGDCLYLLDGRFDQLHTFIIDLLHIRPSDELKNQGDLPNLKCLSLTCYHGTLHYDELVLPLLYRMSNLEQLGLYLAVYGKTIFIDGNNLKKDILNRLLRLNQFTFYISSTVSFYDEMNLLSTEDIQRTFVDLVNSEVISYVDHFVESKENHCHIYSYPFVMQYFDEISNNFPGGLFNYVRVISLFDEYPFEHEFFLQIQKSFPFVEHIFLTNHKSQKYKQCYQPDHQNLSLIKYSCLNELFIVNAHDDYIEQFLIHNKTYLQNNTVLHIKYESLERVTHNFTRDITRINCAKIIKLRLRGEAKCYIGAYLIIVGVDVTGSHIAAIEPYGTASYMPYLTSGSGGYTSLSVIEDRFKQDMNEDEAKQLVRDALYASITTDLYSGSKINMYVLTKEKLDKFLPYETIAVRGDRQTDSILEKGVEVLSTSVKKIEFDIVNEKVKENDETMELA